MLPSNGKIQVLFAANVTPIGNLGEVTESLGFRELMTLVKQARASCTRTHKDFVALCPQGSVRAFWYERWIELCSM